MRLSEKIGTADEVDMGNSQILARIAELLHKIEQNTRK